MIVNVETNSGLMNTWFSFSFNKEEMGPNNDVFFTTMNLFYNGFLKAKTVDMSLKMQRVYDNTRLENFVVKTIDFRNKEELKVLDEACDYVIAFDHNKSRFRTEETNQRVSNGLEQAKEFAKKVKEDIRARKIAVRYTYTDPFS